MPSIRTTLRLAALALVTFTAAACRTAAPSVEYLPLAGALGQQHLPFSAAVRVGHTIYVSGQIGSDSTGQLVAGGIGPETRQALENIKATLARAGATMDDVVKCTAFVADMREWPAMNDVYVTYFTHNLPARSAFGANGLARNARVELDCIAVH